jgi:hypothetical protein
MTRSTFCDLCQDSSTLGPGATDISSCRCDAGFYGDPPNVICLRCILTEGIECPFNSSVPWIAPGFYRGNDIGVALRCSPADACSKTEYQNTTCKLGYEGFLCGQCSGGFYRTGGSCKECPGAAVKWITITLALAALVFILLRVTSRKTELPADIRVTLQAIQMIGLFPNITSKWPRYVQVVLQIYSLAVSSFPQFELFSN